MLILMSSYAEDKFELQKRGTSKSGKYGSLVLRLQLIKSNAASVSQAPGIPDSVMEHAVDGANRDVANLSRFEGASSTIGDITSIGDGVAAMTSSQGFALVCGYVEKLMEIGNVISQVSS
jgi:hypothetical protein